MNIKDFLAQNVEKANERKEVHFPRFKSPFIIRGLTEDENDQIRKASEYTTKDGTKEVDMRKYTYLLAVNSTVFPELDNAELQASYGTEGDPVKTLKRMLNAGEFLHYLEQINEINGMNEDFEDDIKE